MTWQLSWGHHRQISLGFRLIGFLLEINEDFSCDHSSGRPVLGLLAWIEFKNYVGDKERLRKRGEGRERERARERKKKKKREGGREREREKERASEREGEVEGFWLGLSLKTMLEIKRG